MNVDKSVEIGISGLKKFLTSLPEGFHKTISKEVKTMAEVKKGAKINETMVYNTDIIFSRVMCLISADEIDIKQVWAFELSPIVPSLFNQFGEGRYPKNKSELKNALKVEVTKRSVGVFDLVILDGCALLWTTHRPIGGTISDFAEIFLKKIQVYLGSSDVYLEFDRYHQYSTKSCTREARVGSVCSHHTLSLFSPLLPQENVLKSTKNKVQLIDILTEYLLTNVNSKNRLIVTGSADIPEQVLVGVRQKRFDLRSTHEEADLIIAQHAFAALHSGAKCLKVVSDDTDVFVILLHFFYHLKGIKARILMEATKEQWKLIDIGLTADKHSSIMPSLLAGHALSGCDSVPQLFGIGKKTMKKQIEKHPLTKLGQQDANISEVFSECTGFISACYGFPNECSMSELRYQVWRKRIEGGKVTKSFKLCSLPPTKEGLEQNILRAHFQCAMWRSSLHADPQDMNPTDYGYLKD